MKMSQSDGHINTTTVDYTVQMIREAGFIPVQRTTLYDILESMIRIVF